MGHITTHARFTAAPPVRRPFRPRSLFRRAYTLLELLIVIALLGLASAIVVPYLNDRGDLELQGAVRLIWADIVFAQADALAHQEYRRVQFFEDGSGYALVRVTDADFSAEFDPDTADYIHDPLASGDQNYIVDFSADNRWGNVSISSVDIDGGNDFITFDALAGTVMSGGSPGTGGSIIVESEGVQYRIDLAPFTGKLTSSKL
jgi:prepilin-type N-terminal cleavage/methylation domain-containing protein